MSHLDPIAYTYEADHHCESCAERGFWALPALSPSGTHSRRPCLRDLQRDHRGPRPVEEGSMMTIDSVREGSRVELHPRLDAWMMGDRFGTVQKTGRKYVHVLMDRSGRVRRIAPEDLTIVREA